MAELVALMKSAAKTQANRNNSKKSTGPRSPRGKALSKFNAHKHGLFALERLIPGENEKHYEALSARLVSELAPTCVVECTLVDQIISDVWRLRRLEQAEWAYLSSVQEVVLERHVRMQSDKEIEWLDQHLQRLSSNCGPPTTAWHEDAAHALGIPRRDCEAVDNRSVDHVEFLRRPLASTLDRVLDVSVSLLESMVDSSRAFPIATLGEMRRSLVRDILRKWENLAELRGHRANIVPRQGTG